MVIDHVLVIWCYMKQSTDMLMGIVYGLAHLRAFTVLLISTGLQLIVTSSCKFETRLKDLSQYDSIKKMD